MDAELKAAVKAMREWSEETADDGELISEKWLWDCNLNFISWTHQREFLALNICPDCELCLQINNGPIETATLYHCDTVTCAMPCKTRGDLRRIVAAFGGCEQFKDLR